MARRWIGLYGLVALFALADQLCKWWMLWLVFVPERIIPLLPFLNLAPVYNTGIAFGLLGSGGDIATLALTALAVAVGLGLPYAARDWPQPGRIGALLMAGGALGNAIDRIRLGKVIDFIDMHIAGWHWPAFNLADSMIVLGVAALVWQSWRDRNSGGGGSISPDNQRGGQIS